MSGPGPSTVVGEPPDAPPAISGATRPEVSGDAAVASSLGVPDLPSSQEELDVPLSALLGDLSGHPVGSAREGEKAGPPPRGKGETGNREGGECNNFSAIHPVSS